ncbi:MAG TPA: fused MFS/spermidine synthase [Lacipirellulaceae bacterium]|nr:fused MFS/spermidine synthase [Lacipirellulaceae bacterium]
MRGWAAVVAGSAALLLGRGAAGQTALAPPATDSFAGRLEFDGASEFSHIRIRRRGDVRSLLFVRDSGEEALETQVNLRRPAELQFEYLQFLFASYLLRERPSDVLIVGLGGGGMVHFLRANDPGVRVDAVEIDPLVVELAGKYFGVEAGGNVNIVTADALQYIAEAPPGKYDVIYLDAFLKPSAETDSTGVPLTLRTAEFYRQLQSKLKPGGVAAFNINPHEGMRADADAIAAAFPQTYEFPLARYAGLVVLASTDPTRVPRREMIERARRLDPRFTTSINFAQMARRVQE